MFVLIPSFRQFTRWTNISFIINNIFYSINSCIHTNKYQTVSRYSVLFRHLSRIFIRLRANSHCSNLSFTSGNITLCDFRIRATLWCKRVFTLSQRLFGSVELPLVSGFTDTSVRIACKLFGNAMSPISITMPDNAAYVKRYSRSHPLHWCGQGNECRLGEFFWCGVRGCLVQYWLIPNHLWFSDSRYGRFDWRVFQDKRRWTFDFCRQGK